VLLDPVVNARSALFPTPVLLFPVEEPETPLRASLPKAELLVPLKFSPAERPSAVNAAVVTPVRLLDVLMVIEPAPLVIVMPVPAVKVENENPDPLPIGS
jgi:hypothetical protein